jgi:Domain of unknown function (DUF4249)
MKNMYFKFLFGKTCYSRVLLSILPVLIYMLIVIFNLGCKQPFISPAIANTPSYLVVDGYLNAGNDSTFITLNRTRGMDSSIKNIPELKAQVSVLGPSGIIYPLSEQANGKYTTAALNLNPVENYQLQILTQDGKKYLSDPISIVQTPPIDSISWKMDSTGADNKLGVTVYASTHDPLNKTWYYRWEYVETWEYHSVYDSWNYYANGQVLARDVDSLINVCWFSKPSTNINLATSSNLSQDIIFEKPLVFIPQGTQKLGVRYSIMVKQYGTTKQAYEYWENLKKNTELRGSIFDPQPSQVAGNIHCESNPAEPVLGYVSASTSQQSRIFIESRALPAWNFKTIPVTGCSQRLVTEDSFVFYFGGRGYIPLFEKPPPRTMPTYWAALPDCVDCTLQGGKTQKPSIW